MNEPYKIVLAHPDKQHSFKTAKALIEIGVLDRYITTVYDMPGSLTHFLTKLLKGSFRKKLKAHRSDEIPNAKVKQFCEFWSLLLFLLVRIDKSQKLYSKLKIYRDKVFNKKVAKYCKKNDVSAVISFDVVSAQLYNHLENTGIVKILDMSAPHLHPINDIDALIVYAMQGSDVDTVIVDGKILMQNREITHLDEEKIIYEVDNIKFV